MRFAPLLATLALAACGRSDRPAASSTQSGSTVGYAGPQALLLRVPRDGGPPRVFAYPRVDSLIWQASDPAPAPGRILAFDNESGSVAYEDSRGRPVLLELRRGTITITSPRKLTGLASADGSVIYGISPAGEVVRMTPSGDWTFKPALPAKAVYPQGNGDLLVAIGTGANTRLVKIFPPDKRVLDSIRFPVASHTVRTQLGDRLYLAVDSGLVVFRTRTMDWGTSVPISEPISVMASTPSGDRVFILSEAGTRISVIDRFRDRLGNAFELPGKASDLRVDPFGRYLLARNADADSIWVIALGTQRVIGALRSEWRHDLPFVAYDGSVAVASGADVVFHDGETLRQHGRVRGGTQDYWYPILWDGFRPRAATLDQPVQFDSSMFDTTAFDSSAAPPDSIPQAAAADTAAPLGFVVSFAAFLAEDRARELANRVRVDGENARVVTTYRDGATIYRVILGPYLTHDEADRAGRASGISYWVYEGMP